MGLGIGSSIEAERLAIERRGIVEVREDIPEVVMLQDGEFSDGSWKESKFRINHFMGIEVRSALGKEERVYIQDIERDRQTMVGERRKLCISCRPRKGNDCKALWLMMALDIGN